MKTGQSEFAAYIGLDWADKKHDLCLQVGATGERERLVLEHKPKAIRAWAEQLRKRFTDGKVAVCLELSKGPIVSALMEHDLFVVFLVQPALLAKYRSTFTPSHAKDDPTDAELALELLLRYPHRVRRLKPESADMRLLRQLVEVRRGLVDDRVRVTNQILANLKAYFPQAVSLFPDKEASIFADFLEQWPTFQAAKKARRSALESFFRDHNVRLASTIERRIAAIKDDEPLTTDASVIGPAQLVVELLLPQLRALCTAIERIEGEIDRCCARLADYKLFSALPGAGPALAPRLIALDVNVGRFCSISRVEEETVRAVS